MKIIRILAVALIACTALWAADDRKKVRQTNGKQRRSL